MQTSTASRIAIALAIVVTASTGFAATLGTKTITDAAHYGRRANVNNTVTTFTPAASGTIKWVTITGTLTSTNDLTWARSLRVQPSGTSLATGAGTPKGQGYFYLSPEYEFTDPIAVNMTVAVPGGIVANGPLTFEAYSVDSESATEGVPGLDGRSTLTYTFLDALPNGGAEFNGSLTARTPTWNRAVNYNGDPDGTPILDVSATGTAVKYTVQPFSVATDGQYAIAIAGGFDTEVFLYSGAFDPTKPLQNLVDGNDSGRNTLRSRGLAGAGCRQRHERHQPSR